MTLKYLGIHPHYEVVLTATNIVITCGNRPSQKKRGETVKLVEVIEVIDDTVNIPMNKALITRISLWDFRGE